MRNLQSWKQQIGLWATVLWALALLAPGVASATEVATVTAVVGDVVCPSGQLSQNAAVGEDEAIQTSADGNLALLLEEDAVVEMCGGTSVSLPSRAEERGKTRIVRVDAGESRIVVEPRAGEDRIEIHTPVAIATILGTVVFVKVDPETGETSFYSADNEVAIRNSDASVAGVITISGGEEAIVERGAPPRRARKLGPEGFAQMGGCTVDLPIAALAATRRAREPKTLIAITRPDVIEVLPPPVGAGATSGGPDIPEPGPPSPPTPTTDPINNPIDEIDEIIEQIIDEWEESDPCSGLPSEQCGGVR